MVVVVSSTTLAKRMFGLIAAIAIFTAATLNGGSGKLSFVGCHVCESKRYTPETFDTASTTAAYMMGGETWSFTTRSVTAKFIPATTCQDQVAFEPVPTRVPTCTPFLLAT